MHAPGPDRIYYSKISRGLLVFILLVLGIPLVVTLVQGVWTGFAIVLLTSILPLSMYRNTRYETRNHTLFITCGFLYKQRIDINRIRSIRNSRNLISSPALSLDRQEIRYNTYDEVLISLKEADKEDFYAAVKQINPDVQFLHS